LDCCCCQVLLLLLLLMLLLLLLPPPFITPLCISGDGRQPERRGVVLHHRPPARREYGRQVLHRARLALTGERGHEAAARVHE
jgi:hypothetical protein